jgi:hypothetical protein
VRSRPPDETEGGAGHGQVHGLRAELDGDGDLDELAGFLGVGANEDAFRVGNSSSRDGAQRRRPSGAWSRRREHDGRRGDLWLLAALDGDGAGEAAVAVNRRRLPETTGASPPG